MIADAIRGENPGAAGKIDIARRGSRETREREREKIDINRPGSGGIKGFRERRTHPPRSIESSLRSSKANNCLPKIDYPRVR